MKNILLVAVLAAMTVLPLSAQQRLIRGDKAPELQVKEWITQAQPSGGRAMMVEFFHSGNSTSVARVAQLDATAREAAGKLNVVVITREDSPAVKALLGDKAFFAGIDDDGKTFAAFSTLYVPYTVIVDKRGRVAWHGNPASLTSADITQLIK